LSRLILLPTAVWKAQSANAFLDYVRSFGRGPYREKGAGLQANQETIEYRARIPDLAAVKGQEEGEQSLMQVFWYWRVLAVALVKVLQKPKVRQRVDMGIDVLGISILVSMQIILPSLFI
jgi:hypothetical protein